MTTQECEDKLIQALKECYFEIVTTQTEHNDKTFLLRNMYDEVILNFGDYVFSIYYEHCIHDFKCEHIVDILATLRGIEIHTTGDSIYFIFTTFGISEMDSYLDEIKGE